jgi:tetratricopeptide (TPR) repeat protein
VTLSVTFLPDILKTGSPRGKMRSAQAPRSLIRPGASKPGNAIHSVGCLRRQRVGSAVRVKNSIILLFFVASAFAERSPNQHFFDSRLPDVAPTETSSAGIQSEAQSQQQFTELPAVTTTQLAAWLIGGVSSTRLAAIASGHKLANLPTQKELKQLEAAGAGKDLMKVVESGNVRSAQIGPAIPLDLLKAALEAHQQHFHEAEILLRAVVAADANNPALHFALGVILRQQEQWDDSYDELEQALHLMPELPENHNAMAYLFYRLDDGPNTIAEARTALSLDPKNAEAYQYMGLGHYSLGDYSAAIHAFGESLEHDRDNADTYYDMGIALHAAGDAPAAIAAYQKAIELRPAFWEAYSNLGLIRHEQGDLAQAAAEYQEAKRIAPGEPSVRNNLGNTYCDQGKFDAAIEELRELYRQHPEWQQGHACMASAYMAKGNFDAAVTELQLAVQQNPTGSTEHRILGQALLLANRPEDALRELRIAVSLNPDSDLAHHLLGTVLFQQQELPAAEKEFREALRIKASADNHYSLAACLMSMDRYEEALSELDLAARLDPQRTLYRARREELLKLMKESSSQ